MEQTVRELLERLQNCTSEEFLTGVGYIDHLIEKPELEAGKGYLLLKGSSEKPFKIEVSGVSKRNEQVLIFIHEIFHVPFVLRSILDIDNKQLHDLFEKGIDDASEKFLKHNTELALEQYRKLLKPS